MHLRGLILDLDDTLYPRERFVRGGFAAAARQVAARCGVPAERALATLLRARHTHPGRELQVLCTTLRLPDAIVPDLVDVCRTHTPALWLYHDAADVLGRLRATGWRLAILTNGLPHVQAAKIKALGLRPLVDHVVFAAEYADAGKPHPHCFAEVLRRFRLPATSCVMVGDDPHCDICGARDAGILTIEIDRSGRVRTSRADCVLQSLRGLPAAAESLLDQVHAHAA